MRRELRAMKKYKEHEIVEKSYYYVTRGGVSTKQGKIKPGTTQQEKISNRINRIRFDEPDMHLAGFLTIYNTHKARLEALEHSIKADLVDARLQHYSNDHFRFTFMPHVKRKLQYKVLTTTILAKAVQYCKEYNLEYEVTLWE